MFIIRLTARGNRVYLEDGGVHPLRRDAFQLDSMNWIQGTPIPWLERGGFRRITVALISPDRAAPFASIGFGKAGLRGDGRTMMSKRLTPRPEAPVAAIGEPSDPFGKKPADTGDSPGSGVPRGYSGLDNALYTPVIQSRLEARQFASLKYFADAKDPEKGLFGPSSLTVAGDNVEGRLTRTLTSVELDKIQEARELFYPRLSPDEKDIVRKSFLLFLERLDNGVAASFRLQDPAGKLPGDFAGTHFGVERNQFYFDMDRLKEPAWILAKQWEREVKMRAMVLASPSPQSREASARAHGILAGEIRLPFLEMSAVQDDLRNGFAEGRYTALIGVDGNKMKAHNTLLGRAGLRPGMHIFSDFIQETLLSYAEKSGGRARAAGVGGDEGYLALPMEDAESAAEFLKEQVSGFRAVALSLGEEPLAEDASALIQRMGGYLSRPYALASPHVLTIRIPPGRTARQAAESFLTDANTLLRGDSLLRMHPWRVDEEDTEDMNYWEFTPSVAMGVATAEDQRWSEEPANERFEWSLRTALAGVDESKEQGGVPAVWNSRRLHTTADIERNIREAQRDPENQDESALRGRWEWERELRERRESLPLERRRNVVLVSLTFPNYEDEAGVGTFKKLGFLKGNAVFWAKRMLIGRHLKHRYGGGYEILVYRGTAAGPRYALIPRGDSVKSPEELAAIHEVFAREFLDAYNDATPAPASNVLTVWDFLGDEDVDDVEQRMYVARQVAKEEVPAGEVRVVRYQENHLARYVAKTKESIRQARETLRDQKEFQEKRFGELRAAVRSRSVPSYGIILKADPPEEGVDASKQEWPQRFSRELVTATNAARDAGRVVALLPPHPSLGPDQARLQIYDKVWNVSPDWPAAELREAFHALARAQTWAGHINEGTGRWEYYFPNPTEVDFDFEIHQTVPMHGRPRAYSGDIPDGAETFLADAEDVSIIHVDRSTFDQLPVETGDIPSRLHLRWTRSDGSVRVTSIPRPVGTPAVAGQLADPQLVAGFLKPLFERFPRLTAVVAAPLMENGFVMGPAYLILTSLSGFLIPMLLAMGWAAGAAWSMAYLGHKNVFVAGLKDEQGRLVSRPATPSEQKEIFHQFLIMGGLSLLLPGLGKGGALAGAAKPALLGIGHAAGVLYHSFQNAWRWTKGKILLMGGAASGRGPPAGNETEARLLQAALQAYQYGDLHAPEAFVDPEWRFLDAILRDPAAALYEPPAFFPSADDLSRWSSRPMDFAGEGRNFLAFRDEEAPFVVKYVKTERSLEEGTSIRNGRLTRAIWDQLRSFESYGDVAVPVKVFIAQADYDRLDGGEKGRLQRFRDLGLVDLMAQPVTFLSRGHPDHLGAGPGRVHASVLVVQSAAVPLRDELLARLRAGDYAAAEALIDEYLELVRSAWRRGAFMEDFSMFNVGREETSDHIRIFDGVHVKTDFRTGRPAGDMGKMLHDIYDAGHRYTFDWIKPAAEQEGLIQELERLRSYFADKAASLFSQDGFNGEWNASAGMSVATAQKGALRNHDLFKKLFELVEKEGGRLTVTSSPGESGTPIVAGFDRYEGHPLIIASNPTADARPGAEKAWGTIQLPAELTDVVEDDPKVIYRLTDLLTGEHYARSGQELRNGLSVGLSPYRSHLLVFEDFERTETGPGRADSWSLKRFPPELDGAPPSVVVLDFDGTLHDGDRPVSDNVLAAIRRWLSLGRPVVLATGRRHEETEKRNEVERWLINQITPALQANLFIGYGFDGDEEGGVLELPNGDHEPKIFRPRGRSSKASFIRHIAASLGVPVKSFWFVGDDYNAGGFRNDRSVLQYLAPQGTKVFSVNPAERPQAGLISFYRRSSDGTAEIINQASGMEESSRRARLDPAGGAVSGTPAGEKTPSINPDIVPPVQREQLRQAFVDQAGRVRNEAARKAGPSAERAWAQGPGLLSLAVWRGAQDNWGEGTAPGSEATTQHIEGWAKALESPMTGRVGAVAAEVAAGRIVPRGAVEIPSNHVRMFIGLGEQAGGDEMYWADVLSSSGHAPRPKGRRLYGQQRAEIRFGAGGARLCRRPFWGRANTRPSIRLCECRAVLHCPAAGFGGVWGVCSRRRHRGIPLRLALRRG
jgi:hypothetical protein